MASAPSKSRILACPIKSSACMMANCVDLIPATPSCPSYKVVSERPARGNVAQGRSRSHAENLRRLACRHERPCAEGQEFYLSRAWDLISIQKIIKCETTTMGA